MRAPPMQRLAALALLLSVLFLHPALQAQTKPTRVDPGPAPESILWVGNSFFYYNNSMHNHFGRLVASAGPGSRVRGTSVTVSGSGMDWHDMESLLRPNGLGRYSFVGDNEIRFNKPGRQYDTAIMMDCSQCPIHPQLQGAFHETARKFSQMLAKAGTYLAACTVYAALYRKSPVGFAYTAGLDKDLAALLQASAWEATQDYFRLI